jgi:thiamine biosynthesis lipoprotein
MMISARGGQRVTSTDAAERGRRWLVAGLIVLVGLSTWRLLIADAPTTQTKAPITELSGASMGTTYSVKLAGVLEGARHAEAQRAVDHALSEVDSAASTYRQDSELSRFNRTTEIDSPFQLSPVLLPIVTTALEVGQQSAGALDVTVAPLVDAWGFGPEAQRNPTPETVAAMRARVGLHLLQLEGTALKKRRADVALDLSAVAKGYAVDLIGAALEKLGHTDFLVEVGGELQARGQRPDGRPWRVGIEKPISHLRAVERAVALRDMSMATSGDYRNFYEVDGRRRSHLIDPRSGLPIEHALASVTVLHPVAARADAWATALTILGPTAGPELAERHGLAAFFVVRVAPTAFRTIESSMFARAASGETP